MKRQVTSYSRGLCFGPSTHRPHALAMDVDVLRLWFPRVLSGEPSGARRCAQPHNLEGYSSLRTNHFAARHNVYGCVSTSSALKTVECSSLRALGLRKPPE